MKVRHAVKKSLVSFASLVLVVYVRVLLWTTRREILHDPRPVLRANRIPYVFAALHAHQVSAMLFAEPSTGTMVSRSRDGDVIVPALRLLGVRVLRGSGLRRGSSSKGGRDALKALVDHLNAGHPAYVSVDGPNGPRGGAHMGVAALAARTNAVVLPIAAIPSRRYLFTKAWDRLQIPLPFARVVGHVGEPLRLRESETTEGFRQRIEAALNELELAKDPAEGKYAQSLRPRRKAS